ncbi:hypothetical protein DDZ16_06870 [Marinilabilia rubra]|uniref:Uncharacterized protein n=1 Tax=Marinilabilia rubra TaxID=2162893 RepID=A0A2U2BAI2_9BACT|nr:hypothetical protein DDZ16_06870 [Marinilabilia rubra]
MKQKKTGDQNIEPQALMTYFLEVSKVILCKKMDVVQKNHSLHKRSPKKTKPLGNQYLQGVLSAQNRTRTCTA